MFSSLVNPSDSDISFDHYRQLPLDKERMKPKSSKNLFLMTLKNPENYGFLSNFNFYFSSIS